MTHSLEATHLRSNRWAVRPLNQLGTCGFYPYPWTVIYITAKSPHEAISKALQQRQTPDTKAQRQHQE